MDPFNPADAELLGPDGLPLGPKRPMPPQQPPPQDNASLLGDGAEAGFDAVDAVNDVADGGILSGLGDVISGAADLAGMRSAAPRMRCPASPPEPWIWRAVPSAASPRARWTCSEPWPPERAK